MVGCQQHYEASNNSVHLSEHLSICGEGSLAVLTRIILTNSQEISSVIIPILQIRRPGRASKWQHQDLNTRYLSQSLRTLCCFSQEWNLPILWGDIWIIREQRQDIWPCSTGSSLLYYLSPGSGTLRSGEVTGPRNCLCQVAASLS